MPAPRPIFDALDCVMALFLSNTRHNLRAAFIMCDELVEITCRERIKVAIPTLGRMAFDQLLRHSEVGLPRTTHSIGMAVWTSHKTRNDMHHANAAATVDHQYCADAILDAVKAIEHCFPGSVAEFPDIIAVSLRIARLFATGADPVRRAAFVQAMQRHKWQAVPADKKPKAPKLNEVVVAPGDQTNWGLALSLDIVVVDALLDQVGAA